MIYFIHGLSVILTEVNPVRKRKGSRRRMNELDLGLGLTKSSSLLRILRVCLWQVKEIEGVNVSGGSYAANVTEGRMLTFVSCYDKTTTLLNPNWSPLRSTNTERQNSYASYYLRFRYLAIRRQCRLSMIINGQSVSCPVSSLKSPACLQFAPGYQSGSPCCPRRILLGRIF